ncbi:acyl-CoA dehydrogenase family protein [Xanthobacter agilis]|uniref:Pimeloyl-CoA dehydrogenase small subunit n=1 Tax=Xanthobacter agilis TaxID=47492 RepID=A0ABU0LCW8_XANAG|nr:acyl-CoA dehydrogenase [Xanthobacter agilis]MDQ0504971.1 pimeloyl-CoA dehydrogenase small subunit [Xanthobacter agilis]
MDFDLTDEQSLLKDTAQRWAADTYSSIEHLASARAAPLGFAEAKWAELADLGLLGLPFAEGDGGFGGGPVETLVVMEALGRALAPEPYLASVILGGGAVRLAGSQAQRAAVLPGLIDGTARLAFAHSELQARYDLNDVATTARAVEGGFRLDGRKSVVLNADAAKILVVSARTCGERRDGAGITLFLVPADAAGVSLSAYPTQDGGRAADVIFSDVLVPADAVLGAVGGGLAVVERVVEGAIAALCAEAVGLMEALNTLTVDYLKTRKQFGVSIGSFQALQHKAVDMFVALEQARSMALYAAMMVEAEDADERRVALSAAKVQINRSARFVGQTAVQLHGGIGMTMEYIGAHHFRRLAMIEVMFGDTSFHQRRVTAEGGLISAA